MGDTMKEARAIGGLINASDSLSWALCLRRAWLDRNVPDGFEVAVDRFDELVMEMGLEHEQEVLRSLGPYETAMDAEHTTDLMNSRVPVIYQGTIVDRSLGVVAKPDFLILEGEEYRAKDAKLASTMDGKKAQTAQIGTYDIVLKSSHRAMALLPDGETYEIREKDLVTARHFIEDMQGIVNAKSRPDANYTATKCEACPYKALCVPEFKERGNLGLNYFIDNRALPTLRTKGINTLKDISKTTPDVIGDTPYLKKQEKQEMAILQARSLLENKVIRLGPTARAPGTPIHFDIETWPFGADRKGTIYLFGFLPPPYRKEDYEYVWSDEFVGGGDREGWLKFVSKIEEYKQRYPDCTFVHYTDFELHQIRHYAERYEMLEHPTVASMLDGGDLFFDIKKATSDSLILPVTGYGLKHICKNEALVNFQWELEESGSQWSVVRYFDYLRADDALERERIREELLTYNRDDVLGTRAQEVWLMELG